MPTVRTTGELVDAMGKHFVGLSHLCYREGSREFDRVAPSEGYGNDVWKCFVGGACHTVRERIFREAS